MFMFGEREIDSVACRERRCTELCFEIEEG
jgi:hypothetical protein